MDSIDSLPNQLTQEVIVELAAQESNSSKLQEQLDTIFPSERRQQMLDRASRDIRGRPTRYFRYITRDKLAQLLQHGKLDPLDYHSGETVTQDDLENLQGLLTKLIRQEGVHSNVDLPRPLSKLSVQEKAQIYFGDHEQLENLLNLGASWQELRDFVTNHLEPDQVKRYHSNKFGLPFSPFLSVSSGGPIREYVEDYMVQLELVVPDSQIVIHPKTQQLGEREVFVREITPEMIARAFTDTDTFVQAVIEDPSSPLGQYASTYNNGLPVSANEVVGRWRFSEPITDTLPLALAQKYNVDQ